VPLFALVFVEKHFALEVSASASKTASCSIAVTMLRTIESSSGTRSAGDILDMFFFMCCVRVCVSERV